MRYYKVRDLAYELRRSGCCIGERNLWTLLRRNGWVSAGSPVPTKQAVKAGYMVTEQRPVDLPTGVRVCREQLLITARGRLFFLEEVPRVWEELNGSNKDASRQRGSER